MSATYSIGTLAGLSGLTTHTIRAWERRYHAITPTRGETNRRVYSDSDLARLVLLRRLTEAGHSIGHIANQPEPLLKELLSDRRASKPIDALGEQPLGHLLGEGLEAVARLDAERFESVLARAHAQLGTFEFLNQAIFPLLSAIGDRWAAGRLGISQEHMASAVVRSFLLRLRSLMPTLPGAPRLIVTTPKDQHHELGALMVAIVAAMDSWNVTYLGPNLPADEIANAAKVSSAQAIAVSLVYPTGDASLAEEFRKLRDATGPRMPILAGGSGASKYAEILYANKVEICRDLESFRGKLAKIGLP